MSAVLHSRRGVLLFTAAGVMALVLTGCSKDSDGQSGSSGPNGTPSSAVAAEPPKSPLTRYTDVLYGQGHSDKVLTESFRKDEEAIAACMKKAGFDYTPRPVAMRQIEADQYAESPNDRAWVAANGYGINRDLRESAKKLEDLDPNQAYVKSLSDAKQRAYLTALMGTQNQDGGDPNDQGCSGEADSVGGPRSQEARYQPLVKALERLYGEQLPRAAAVVAAEAKWSSCMADAGMPGLASRKDAKALAEKASAPKDNGGAPAPGHNAAGPDPTARAKEIKIALADFDCRTKTNYDAQYRQAQNELEQKFLNDNRQELDALLADAEQDGNW